MNIVTSGGHLTPVYSLVEQTARHADQVLLIGSAGPTSVEASELQKLGARYASIFPVKFDRHHRCLSLIRLPLLLLPLLQSLRYLSSFHPDVVVTFGSFNAVPVGLAAYMLHIPLIIHEQTRTAGLANRLLAPLAVSCALSYQDSVRFFPAAKSTVIGNPVRSVFWQPPVVSPFPFSSAKPIIYVTGGNQGSRSILAVIAQSITDLSQYGLIIQYGKSRFPASSLPADCLARPWFTAAETASIMHQAHVIISRGGANTTAEIMIAGKPSIIIPLPRASNDEQTKNARFIADQGAGLVIPAAQFTALKLKQSLDQLEAKYDHYKRQAEALKSVQNPQAAAMLYRLAAHAAGKK